LFVFGPIVTKAWRIGTLVGNEVLIDGAKVCQLTTKSGIVMPIVATSPLVTMLLSWALDGQRPTRRAAIGGFLAVLGAAGLKYFAAGE